MTKNDDGRKQLERIEHELFLYRMMVDASNDAITLIDRDYIYRIVNQAYRKERQLKKEEILNQSVAHIWGQEIFEHVIKHQLDECFRGNVVHHASAYEFRSNEMNFIETVYTPCYTTAGEVAYAVVTSHNITELKQSQEKIKTLAYYDALTNLPSRPLFFELLNWEIKSARRNKGSLAVLFLDLDEFKKINETLGHSAGDELLVGVGQRLQKYMRQSDTIARPGGVISKDPVSSSGHFARIGGDEFTLIIPKIAHKNEVTTVAKRVLSLFEEPFQIIGQQFYISTSIGIALFPDDGGDAENLLKNADTALYGAKARGKNTFQYYDAEMNKHAQAHIKLENDIRSAIGSNEFLLYYQPVYNLETARVIGMEALIRWKSKEKGLVAPGDFIPIAENTGLIVPIGEWVIQNACRQCKLWHDQGFVDLQLGINLSPRQFYDVELVTKIKNILADVKFDPTLLELEITETAVMRDTDKAIQIINALRSLGIRIALDDFGTGYSSLMHLKTFPINTLKIDQAFIQNAGREGREAAIISAIVDMCHRLEIKAVAEGVETEEHLAFLKGKKCHLGQGFYFSAPLTAGAFEELLNHNDLVPDVV